MNDNNISKVFYSIFTTHNHVDSPTIFCFGAHTSIKLSWYLSGRQWYSNPSRVVQFWLTKWHCFLLLLLIHSLMSSGHLFTTVMVGMDSRQPSHGLMVNAAILFDCLLFLYVFFFSSFFFEFVSFIHHSKPTSNKCFQCPLKLIEVYASKSPYDLFHAQHSVDPCLNCYFLWVFFISKIIV